MVNENRVDELELKLFSFGFKHGMAEEMNILFDVRFLPNPYWQQEMRHLNGLQDNVADYVLNSESGASFLTLALPMIQFLIKENCLAKKKKLYIAVGCTGGRHRSVAVVEKLATLLRAQTSSITVEHRDIEKT